MRPYIATKYILSYGDYYCIQVDNKLRKGGADFSLIKTACLWDKVRLCYLIRQLAPYQPKLAF